MALSTPLADIGWQAPPFRLKGVDGHYHALKQLAGRKATIVVFVSNSCPYVQAVMPRLIRDAQELAVLGVRTIAINANDDRAYPEEGYANMKAFAQQWQLPFPYLRDDTQAVAQAFDAVCTPDFFVLDAALRLQYRGRIDAAGPEEPADDLPRELFDAARLVAYYGYGPGEQFASTGCSIKWRVPQEDAAVNWLQPAS